MSKAILVMDMPTCCGECCLCDDWDSSGLFCIPSDKYFDGEDSMESRASFCPLREVPKKRRTRGKESENDQLCINAGWNYCIDAILKEGAE